MKKIMILGAGYNQLPAIKKAVELGLYVITVDYLPDNIGHKYSHRYVNCSTTDRECVLKYATELKIDGIMTLASDVATTTVAYVAEKLGINGSGYEIAKIMSNKSLFRSFQKKNKLAHPGFIYGKDYLKIEKEVVSLKFPIIVKPVDTSGSRGITKIEEYDKKKLKIAFNYAQGYSSSNIVCFEEYVTGIDISGDGFVKNGEIVFIVITKKIKKNFIPIGHLIPTELSQSYQNRIISEVQATCTALGYYDGPFDFDAKIDDNKVIILEISPRLGGNGIPSIIEFGTKTDIIEATIKESINTDFSFPKRIKFHKSCASWIFGCDLSGTLMNITEKELVLKEFPEVFHISFNYNIGDSVPLFENSSNSLGFVLLECNSFENYLQITSKIRRFLKIKLEN